MGFNSGFKGLSVTEMRLRQDVQREGMVKAKNIHSHAVYQGLLHLRIEKGSYSCKTTALAAFVTKMARYSSAVRIYGED